jgi:carbon monoxide dehydrogenase subunit G
LREQILVHIDKSFLLPVPAADAWAVLRDVSAVAACLPGARITEQVAPSRYRGEVSVRLGPATARFRGDIEIVSRDEGRRELRLSGRGNDRHGGAAATLELATFIRAATAGCELVGHAEVTLDGELPSVAGRMVDQVADQVAQQFARNFAARVAAAESGPAQPLNGLELLWSSLRSLVKDLLHHGPKHGRPA